MSLQLQEPLIVFNCTIWGVILFWRADYIQVGISHITLKREENVTHRDDRIKFQSKELQ